MGHYRSEMISDEEFEKEERERMMRNAMMDQGALALKRLFGDDAAAVAYLLAEKTCSPSFGITRNAERFAEEFNRAVANAESRTTDEVAQQSAHYRRTLSDIVKRSKKP